MPRHLLVSVALLGVLLAGCATPVPPSGGPVDRSPPRIVSVDPSPGSVRVEGRTVRIEFGDWMDENSLLRGLTITPEPDIRPTIRWRRRAVEIVFAEEFRPNTTYVLTLDRDLRTFRGGTLDQPLTIAFSTGDRIDQGRLSGRVVDPVRGDAVQGIDVFAYRGPVDRDDALPLAALPERPDYRTQTGSDGAFTLEHVAEGPYFVMAVGDANRNRRLDPGEALAVPPEPWIVADSLGTPPRTPWIRTTGHMLAPQLNRVRVLSSRHLELRFDRGIVLPDRDPTEFSLAAVEGATPPAVADVFSRAADRRFLYLILSGGISEGRFRMDVPPVTDSLGMRAAAQSLEFNAAPSPDTLRQRFVAFLPDTLQAAGSSAELLYWQTPGFRLHMPESRQTLLNGITVADTLGATRDFDLNTDDGTTFRLELDPRLAEGEIIDVTIRLDGIEAVQRFRRLSEAEVGEITGTVLAGDDQTTGFVIELYADEMALPLRALRLDGAGPFMLAGLPEGDYRLRAFVDRRGDGRWDGGAASPYRPSAPLRWVPQVVSVRPRWETALPEPISFADPPDASAEQIDAVEEDDVAAPVNEPDIPE